MFALGKYSDKSNSSLSRIAATRFSLVEVACKREPHGDGVLTFSSSDCNEFGSTLLVGWMGGCALSSPLPSRGHKKPPSSRSPPT